MIMRSLFVFSVVVILTANMRNTPAAAQAVGQQISSQATTNAVSPKKAILNFIHSATKMQIATGILWSRNCIQTSRHRMHKSSHLYWR